MHIWRKIMRKLWQMLNRNKLRKSIILPIFLPFGRCYMILPYYLLSNYIFCITYRLGIWHFEVISNLHVQRSKFGRNINKFGIKSIKKLNSTEFMEFFFHVWLYFHSSKLSVIKRLCWLNHILVMKHAMMLLLQPVIIPETFLTTTIRCFHKKISGVFHLWWVLPVSVLLVFGDRRQVY